MIKNWFSYHFGATDIKQSVAPSWGLELALLLGYVVFMLVMAGAE